MATPVATEYIDTRVSTASNDSAKAALTTLQELYTQKLWHQLTEHIKTLLTNPNIDDKRSLYTSFLMHFETKLNPVSLVQILSHIVRAELDHNPSEALAFLTPLLKKEGEKDSVVTASDDSHVLLLSHVAVLHMRATDNAACKIDVDAARILVEAAHNMDPFVHSAFYQAAAEYHKVIGTASDFFRNALQFLAYTPPHSLDIASQHRWAFDIGIAALVGNDIYNFGEVLSHSIVHSLRGTDKEWLLLLLEAFNSGDLEKFDVVCQQSSAQMNAQPVLVAHEEFLKQKVTILALMELCFSRSLENSISFADVQKACRLPLKEVEYLLMRSMSLGLISGEIDNVDQSISVSRVQPRVLGAEPIRNMAKRLSKWCQHVTETVTFLKKNTAGIVE